jgi:hypothetical protein
MKIHAQGASIRPKLSSRGPAGDRSCPYSSHTS